MRPCRIHLVHGRLYRSHVVTDASAARSVQLAMELSTAGATFVVVGGVARFLAGEEHRPRDLDIVVPPSGVDRLAAALRSLGTATSASVLLRVRDVSLSTSYGPLDVFVTDMPAAHGLDLSGVSLQVIR